MSTKTGARHERRTDGALNVPLGSLQRWFAAAVMHPRSVAASLDEPDGDLGVDARRVEDIVAPSASLTGLQRLEIYHRAYRARLVECLADDYPALQHALGAPAFEELCLSYIASHPSRSPSLNFFGRRMASFCRERPGPHAAFTADLAELEWAMVEVLHAPAAHQSSPDILASLPPARWSAARFVASSTLRVLELDYPANAYLQDFRTEKEPAIPEPAWSATAIFRDGLVIWRMDLSPAMHALLAALVRGDRLGDALTAVAEAHELSEEEAPQVMLWFRDWVRHGFFAGIELPED